MSMGITSRKEGSVEALLDKLWTENGILVEFNPEAVQNVFWDRATLYALQGIFKVGETDRGYEKLRSLSRKRLLGDHVPYVVEAYPENNMKHLSAESALYCRIITEGMLGIEPMSFNTFKITPSLPTEWNFLNLRNFKLMGSTNDIEISREGSYFRLIITDVTSNKQVVNKKVKSREEVLISLN